MFSLVTYLLILGGLLALLFVARLKAYSGEIVSGSHYGLLAVIGIQGFFSMIFNLLGITLSITSISIANLISLFILSVWILLFGSPALCIKPKLWLEKKTLISHSLSLLVSLLLGIYFFSTNLTPSSMTGDPARHFQLLVPTQGLGEASVYKPVLYLFGRIVMQLVDFVGQDKSFVLLNMLVFFLYTSSCMLLYCRIHPTTSYLALVTTTLLVSTGYAFFSLQYGYITLILSCSFLFSIMSLLVEHNTSNNLFEYSILSLLTIGLILTHSYLAPDALACIIAATIWGHRGMQLRLPVIIKTYGPFWVLILIVALISNYELITGAHIRQTIMAEGWGNEDPILNLLPFLPFFFLFVYISRKSSPAHPLFLLTGGIAFFSLVMGVLYLCGHAAAYYLNRNQIALLPLITFGAIALIDTTDIAQLWSKFLSRLLLLIAAISVLTPYFLFPRIALSSSGNNIRDLLDTWDFVYIQNAFIANHSPLQMTDSDRTIMEDLGACDIHPAPERMAVLGTDHEVIWFWMYTGIYPSLFERSDGFIDFTNYRKNYELWKSNPAEKYIAVVSHFDYWGVQHIVEDIRLNSKLICKGNTIEIFRKNSS